MHCSKVKSLNKFWGKQRIILGGERVFQEVWNQVVQTTSRPNVKEHYAIVRY